MKHSDHLLQERLKRKEEKAFDVFYETYFPKVFRYAFILLRNKEKAESVTEVVLVETIHSLGVSLPVTLDERLFRITRRILSRDDAPEVNSVQTGHSQ